MTLRDPSTSLRFARDDITVAMSFHANVFAQKGRNIEVLTFDNGRLAFFESATRGRFELQNFLFWLGKLFLRWLYFFFRNRFFLRHDQARFGFFVYRWRRRNFLGRR